MTTNLTKRDVQYIEECHPEIQKVFYAAAASSDCPSFTVIDGARTIAEQRINVANGASKTMRSRHIRGSNGWSHAIDVAPLVKRKPSWDWKYYHPLAKAIKDICKALNIRLQWGGDWKSFKDGPHWQLSWHEYSGNTQVPDFNPDISNWAAEEERGLRKEVVPRQGVDNFRKSIVLVLDHEGGYVNSKSDKGGPTNKGITLATYRRFVKKDATITDLRQMSVEVAVDIYKQWYWDACRCDMLPLGIDHAVFDFAVNSGVHRATTFLQSIVDTKVDGRIGPATIAAVNAIMPAKIVTTLCKKRQEYVETRPNKADYIVGWTARIMRVKEEALSMITTRQKKEGKIEVAAPIGKSFVKGIFGVIRSLFSR